MLIVMSLKGVLMYAPKGQVFESESEKQLSLWTANARIVP